MVKILITILMLLVSLEFAWRKNYAPIDMQLDAIPIWIEYSFPACFVLYLVLYPFIAHRYIKEEGGRRVFIHVLSMVLSFTPAMLLYSFPFDKNSFTRYSVVVKESYQRQSGGSAPRYYLLTSSWRAQKEERFSSDSNLFKNFKPNQRVEVKIGQDIFGRLRTISIE